MELRDYEQDRLRAMVARNPDLIVNGDLVQLVCPHYEKVYFPRAQPIVTALPDDPASIPESPRILCRVECGRCRKQLPDEMR